MTLTNLIKSVKNVSKGVPARGQIQPCHRPNPSFQELPHTAAPWPWALDRLADALMSHFLAYFSQIFDHRIWSNLDVKTINFYQILIMGKIDTFLWHFRRTCENVISQNPQWPDLRAKIIWIFNRKHEILTIWPKRMRLLGPRSVVEIGAFWRIFT